MPTGGVNEKNLLDYLSFNKIICCGGSWMVPGDAVKAKDWDRIRALTSSAVQLMLGLEIAHVGINSADEAEAMDTATKLCKLLGWTMKVGNNSIFAGTGIEVMKTPFRGTKGHIGIKTNFHRARQGVSGASGLRVRREQRQREGWPAQGDLPQGRDRGLRDSSRAEVISLRLHALCT